MEDQNKVIDMVDMPSFPTEFENGVVLDHASSTIEVLPVEVEGDRTYADDRVYMNKEDIQRKD